MIKINICGILSAIGRFNIIPQMKNKYYGSRCFYMYPLDGSLVSLNRVPIFLFYVLCVFTI